MPSQQTSKPVRRPTDRIRKGRINARGAALILISQLAVCSLIAVTVSARPVPRSDHHVKHPFIYSTRGGKDDANKDTEEEEEDQVSPSSRPWSTGALYRLNEDTMADAQTQNKNEDESPVDDKKNLKLNKKKGYQQQQQKVDRAQNGRGGALTAAKSHQTANPQRTGNGGIFRWLGPPTTDAERTSSDQHKSDAGSAKTNEEESSKRSNHSATSTAHADLAKLWWVNVLTQQFPDRLDHLDQQNSNTHTEKESEPASKPSKESETGKSDNQKHKKSGKKSSKKHAKRSSKHEEAESELALKTDSKNEIIIPKGTGVQQNYEHVKNITSLLAQADETQAAPKQYVSTGYWAAIDGLTSLGLSRLHPAFRISRPLRPIRKVTARVTGLHGALSGKPRAPVQTTVIEERQLGEDDLAMVRRRIAAIDRARQGVERVAKSDEAESEKKRDRWWGRKEPVDIPEVKHIALATVATGMTDIPSIRKTPEELKEERERKERVQEIDKLMSESQQRLQQLACEKDDLQRRHNPLWNYTTERVSKRRGNQTTITTRKISFPPDDLVEEYLDVLFSSNRLVKLNHTDLWEADANLDDDEDESIGDDLLSDDEDAGRRKQGKNGNGGGGSWLLRQSMGSKQTLGEKIGEAAEQAAYKSIAKAVMEVLAKSISALHGVNIMTHTDIRLSMEATPDLPPMSKQGIIPGGRNPNYARDALQGAMRRGAKRNENRYAYDLSDDTFVQRDAVVETLLSHCQISAPLLKLFPLAWQRAMLGNIITLVTAVVSDFCEGVQFEILGHKLSFSFKPITESDMIDHLAMAGPNFNRQSVRSEQFEAAVQATANDVSENLKFLDRWHERALGSGMLRSQIANLIARLVLTLAGEVLSGAQMDLWAAQASGPRMVAGLEFRTTSTYMNPI